MTLDEQVSEIKRILGDHAVVTPVVSILWTGIIHRGADGSREAVVSIIPLDSQNPEHVFARCNNAELSAHERYGNGG